MKRVCRARKKQVSVRLGGEIERLAFLYAEANGISIPESVRELLHFFKFIVYVVNGLDELKKIVSRYGDEIFENSMNAGGIKTNVALTNNDIEFLDTVAQIIRGDRSSALRFSILSLYYVINYLVVCCRSCRGLSERGQDT